MLFVSLTMGAFNSANRLVTCLFMRTEDVAATAPLDNCVTLFDRAS